jgi:asparagine synthase (glutamine-hydrolysing)
VHLCRNPENRKTYQTYYGATVVKGRISVGKRHKNRGLIIQVYGEITTISGEPVPRDENIMDIVSRGYLDEEESFFKRLDGPFSLAIEDYKSGKLILIRDKIGKIPIYYSLQSTKLFWGNRISDIVGQGEYEPEINDNAIHEYLVYRYISSRNTLFRNIFEVLPAHYLTVELKTGGVEEHAYWDIPYPSVEQLFPANESSLVNRIEEILAKSISAGFSQNMRHGVMSSGGVDSSLIVAIASKVLKERLSTYFIGFDGYESDRCDDAKAVAQWYNSDHSTFYLNAEQYAQGLPEAIRIHEEPLNHPGHVGRVLFNKHMQGQVDCLHLGEGVDTMFCGSKIYPLMKFAYQYNYLRGLTKKIFEYIPLRIVPDHFKRYYCMIRDAFIMDPGDYLIRSLGVNDHEVVNKLIQKKYNSEYLDYYQSFVKDYTRKNIHIKYLQLNQHPFMVEVLNSEFKFGCAYNIQNHYPFLDVNLVSYANHIPFGLRSRGLTGKYIIKKLAEKYFPRSFVYKRKEGFGVPLKRYFDDPRGMGRYYDLLRDKRTLERGIFDPKCLTIFVDNIRKREETSEDIFEGLLWTFINLELWCRIYLDRDPLYG